MHVTLPVCVCVRVLLLSIQVENVPEEIIRTKDKVTFMWSFIRSFVCRFVSSNAKCPHTHSMQTRLMVLHFVQCSMHCDILPFAFFFYFVIIFIYCVLCHSIIANYSFGHHLLCHQWNKPPPLFLSLPPSLSSLSWCCCCCCCCRRTIAPLLIIRYCVLYLLICRNPLLPQNTKHCMDKWKQTESSK